MGKVGQVFYVFIIRALMLGIFAAPQSNLLNLKRKLCKEKTKEGNETFKAHQRNRS